MIGYLTYDEAIVELSRLMENPNSITQETLKSLVEKVSVQDPNAKPGVTTYLYSGMVNEGLYSGAYVSILLHRKAAMPE